MEFIIQKDLFLNTLRIAEHISSTKGIQIILSNVYIEATEDNEVILKSSDLDIGVILKINATVKVPGKITLPSKKLSEIVSKLPKDEVNFEASEETNKAKITSGRAKFELMGISALEYPVIMTQDDIESFKNNISLEIKPFISAIKQTIYAASTAENNSIYNGVFMSINETNLEMAATDGARLSMVVETIENKENKTFESIIPSRTLAEFIRFASSCVDTKVEIMKKDGQLIFKIGDNIMISRSIEGQYPKYKQIIPKDNDKIALVSREDFINALDRTASMVEEKKNVVKLTFEKDQLSLVVDNPELGDSNDFVDIEFDEEEPIKIAFNCKYLLDVLRNYESEKIRIELKPTLAPTLLKPEGNEKYLALIMPIQIKE